MEEKKINIYDGADIVGNVEITFNSPNALMAIYEVCFPDSTIVDVLYIAGLEYGIVLSKEIASKIREAL